MVVRESTVKITFLNIELAVVSRINFWYFHVVAYEGFPFFFGPWAVVTQPKGLEEEEEEEEEEDGGGRLHSEVPIWGTKEPC